MGDSLIALNATSAKYSKWIVRILYGQLVNYTFKTRKGDVKSQKFQGVLVGADPR